MKTHRPKKKRHTQRIANRGLAGIESLESRQVLAANLLASTVNSISTAGEMDQLEVTVDIPNASAGTTATLIFEVTSTDGSLNPAAPMILSQGGSARPSISSIANANGTSGMTVVELPAGDFLIEIAGEGSSTGGYTVTASLLGDVRADDSMVGSTENLQASAALIQALGTGNHVTDLFFRQNGIDPSVSQYDVGFDANMNSVVDPAELGMVEANASAGMTTVSIQADVTGPLVTLALVDDTGTSNTDGATTNPATTLELTDEGQVTQVLATLDGGTEVDITSDLGSLATGTPITISRALLDTIAGGSLSDGAHTLTVSAVDEFGNVTATPGVLNFILITNNVAPTVSTISAQTATEDISFNLDLSTFFSDANVDDILTFSPGDTFPAWLSVSSTGLLTGTPLNGDVGQAGVDVTATDSQGLSVTGSFNVTVLNTNDAPVVAAIADVTIDDNQDLTVALGPSVSDEDIGDSVTISVFQADGINGDDTPINSRDLPAWMQFDSTTNTLSGTPGDANIGTFGIFVLAVDVAGATDAAFFQVNVIDIGEPPEWQAIADDSVDEDVAYSINLSNFASDPDPGDTLTFSAGLVGGGDLPAWLSVNSTTGVLSGTPLEGDDGVLNIQVTATDSTQVSANTTYMLTVNAVNDAPVVENQTVRARPDINASTVIGNVNATDPEGGTLSYTATGGNGAAGFDVDPNTGDITYNGNLALADGDTFLLNVSVTDDGTPALTSTAAITINISLNAPPAANDDSGFSTNDDTELTIAGSALTANDTDPDGDGLTIQSVVATSARGATVTLNSQTQEISYNPRTSTELLELAQGASATDTFTYTVSDGNGGTDTATVTVDINGTDSVEFILRTFDTNGNEITTIDQNTDFELRVFVRDIRTTSSATTGGVFSAFLDVTYPATLASVTGNVVPSSTYAAGASGITTTPGLIDEAGGTDGIIQLGNAEFEVFRVSMQSGSSPGTINFESDPADDEVQRAVLLFLDNNRGTGAPGDLRYDESDRRWFGSTIVRLDPWHEL